MLEQFAANQEFWKDIPFGWITVVLFAFWAGLLAQDLYNKESWLRNNWRVINKLFDVVSLHVAHVEKPPEVISVVLKIKYTRNIKNGELTITSTPLHERMQPFIIQHETEINKPSYSDRKIVVCNLPVAPASHSSWGEDVGGEVLKDGQQTVGLGVRHLVCVELKSRFMKQKIEFFIDALNPNELKNSFVHLERMDEYS